MAVTGTDADKIVFTVLGGEPTGRTKTQLANDAGRKMLGVRTWSWASGTEASLDFVQGQDYTVLPADFQEGRFRPVLDGSLIGGFEWSDLSSVLYLRNQLVQPTAGYFYGALEWDQSGEGAPIARLALYPTPGESKVGALKLWYQRDWTDFDESTPTVAAKIPAWMETVYIQFLKAFARGWEDDLENPGQLDLYLETVVNGMTFREAARRDSVTQADLGTQIGGILGSRRAHVTYLVGTGDPS